MDLESAITELKGVLGGSRILHESAREVFGLAEAYASDAQHFLTGGERDDALEAYSIAWAYVDALLHLGMVQVPDRSLFTVEP